MSRYFLLRLLDLRKMKITWSSCGTCSCYPCFSASQHLVLQKQIYLSTLLIREERFFMNPSSSSGEYFLVFRLAFRSEGSRHSLLSMVVRFGLKLACIGHMYNQHHCFAPLYDVHIENAFRTQFELIFQTGIGRCSKRITIHLNVSDFKEGAWVIGDN